MQLQFKPLKKFPDAATLVFFLGEDLVLTPRLKEVDKESGGAVERAIKAGDFKGKKGKFLSILGAPGAAERIVLAGTGGKKDGIETEYDIQRLGGAAQAFLNHAKAKDACLVAEQKLGGFAPDFVAAHLAYGARLRAYRFDKYFVSKKEEHKPSLESLTVLVETAAEASARYERLGAVAGGVFLTRNVVSEPPNVLYPESYAEICRDELKPLGVKVEILGEKEMKKLGMGSLLGVGQGSERESKLVVMQWQGARRKDDKPLAFVGKGVTFDTGGISIKPSADMDAMKYDMAGSAAVAGLMRALAERKARVNAVGVIGLVENMPDGGAQRPGDVVTSMSGQTIEVLNTDAEGRLVLADALWYTQQRFSPRFMVNLATLTGAITVTFANEYAGLFSNNDELASRLAEAGAQTGEKLWRLPLSKEYDKMIDSKTADMQNISNAKGGGSITAAQFLQRFVNDVPWAHLDIAGVAWTKKALDITPEGATGFGVRLLDKLVENYYEG